MNAASNGGGNITMHILARKNQTQNALIVGRRWTALEENIAAGPAIGWARRMYEEKNAVAGAESYCPKRRAVHRSIAVKPVQGRHGVWLSAVAQRGAVLLRTTLLHGGGN